MSSPTVQESRKAVIAATLGNILEWYDFGIYGILAGVIAQNFFPSSDPNTGLLATFALFGMGFFFRPLGGVLIGWLGDVRGRKPALVLTILLMAFGTLLMGVIPGYASIGIAAPVLLLCARLIQGFSAGGEWGSSTAFMAEWSPPGQRGYWASYQQMSVALGGLLANAGAALLTTLLGAQDFSIWGWRILFVIGGLFGPVGQYLRRRTDETPPFRAIGAQGAAEPEVTGSNFKLALLAFGFTIHWTVCYYTYLTYMPTYTRVQAHLTPAQSLWSNVIGLTALVFLVPMMGALSDRVGRKLLLLGSCVAFFVLPIPFFLVILHHPSFPVIAAIQVVFALDIALFSGPGPAAIAEIFSTRSRSLWMTSSYALAVAIFGGFSPFVATWLIARTGSPLSPAIYVMAAAVISFLVILRLPETAHRPLR